MDPCLAAVFIWAFQVTRDSILKMYKNKTQLGQT